MKLIHIAHRGEAQAFIKNLDIKSSNELDGLYINDDLALLISGEGLDATMSKIALVCGSLPIKKIINLGIAGALDTNIKTGEVYKVRTCYSFLDKVQFKSFTTAPYSNENPSVDCISSHTRVLSSTHAKELSHFAHIVDREVWSVGYIAKIKKLPFESYKLISDIAGKDTDCLDIKDKALSFSNTLYNYFTELEEIETKEFIFETPVPMSFTHNKRYEKLMEIATKKEQLTPQQVLDKLGLDLILSRKVKEKEKTNLLLEKLEVLINPINSIAKKELELAFKPFSDIGCHISFDKSLEKEGFTLKLDINSQKNLDNLKRSIDLFDIKKINDIWNGNFHV